MTTPSVISLSGRSANIWRVRDGSPLDLPPSPLRSACRRRPSGGKLSAGKQGGVDARVGRPGTRAGGGLVNPPAAAHVTD